MQLKFVFQNCRRIRKQYLQKSVFPMDKGNLVQLMLGIMKDAGEGSSQQIHELIPKDFLTFKIK